MDVINLSQQDVIHGDNTESPRQEPQQACNKKLSLPSTGLHYLFKTILIQHLLPVSRPLNLSLPTGVASSMISILHGFTLNTCDDSVKLVLTLNAIPLDKKVPLNNITDWNSFKIKLIEEFRSRDIFGREVNQIFDLLPHYESIKTG